MKRIILPVLFMLTGIFSPLAASSYQNSVAAVYQQSREYLVNPSFKVIFANAEFCVIDAGSGQGIIMGDEIGIYKRMVITVKETEEEHLIPMGVIKISEVKDNSASGSRISGTGDFINGYAARRASNPRCLFLYPSEYDRDVLLQRLLLYLKGMVKTDGIQADYKVDDNPDILRALSRYGKQYDRMVLLSVTGMGESINTGLEIYDVKNRLLLDAKVTTITIDAAAEFTYLTRQQSGGVRWLMNYDLPRPTGRCLKMHDIDKDDIPECVIVTDKDILIYRFENQIEPLLVASRFSVPLPFQSSLFETVDLFFYDFDGSGKDDLVITSNTSPEGSLIYQMEKDTIKFSRRLDAVVSGIKDGRIVSSRFEEFHYGGDSTYLIGLDQKSGNFTISSLDISEDYSDIILVETENLSAIYLNRAGEIKALQTDGQTIRLVDNAVYGPRCAYDGRKYFYFVSPFPAGGEDVIYQFYLRNRQLVFAGKIKTRKTIWDLSVWPADEERDYLVLLYGDREAGREVEIWQVRR